MKPVCQMSLFPRILVSKLARRIPFRHSNNVERRYIFILVLFHLMTNDIISESIVLNVNNIYYNFYFISERILLFNRIIGISIKMFRKRLMHKTLSDFTTHLITLSYHDFLRHAKSNHQSTNVLLVHNCYTVVNYIEIQHYNM
jgi:hypothetical protein